MKLKNIHSRQDFKLNELFGGDQGGVSGKDGFANNASTPGDVIKSLVGGIFKGIGWLWRKSKENFLINRMSAQLINELMRGVILWCFDNNVNLKSGQAEKSEDIPETEDNQQQEPKPEQESNPEPKPEDDDEFELIRKRIKEVEKLEFNPDNPSPEVRKVAHIDIDITKIKEYSNITKYERVEDEAHDFLMHNIENFKNMTDEEQHKMCIVYMNYKVIYNLNRKLKKIQENLMNSNTQFILNEENLVRTVGSTLAHSSGTAKVKMDEPRAGKVGLGKSIAMKAVGAGATVGNILTKRDRDKYKDSRSDDFNLDVHSVNLAEIEKVVNSQGDSAKVSVSDHVNPENLKLIQLTADKLFIPQSTEGGSSDNTSLKIKWNKAMTKVYSSFSNIMDITRVDIRNSDYKNDLNAKLEGKSKEESSKEKGRVDIQKIADNFENALEKEESKLSSLGGSWSYYCFNYKNNFKTSIAPVNYTKGSFYMIMITKAFSNNDSSTHQVTDDPRFDQIFANTKNKKIDGKLYNIVNSTINVYFMYSLNTQFPTGISRNRPNNILVFNNIISNSNSSNNKLYLCNPSENFNLTSVTTDFANNIKVEDYKLKIYTETCRKFIETNLDPWMPALNYIKDKNDVKFCNFQTGEHPKFFDLDKDLFQNLKTIASKM